MAATGSIVSRPDQDTMLIGVVDRAILNRAIACVVQTDAVGISMLNIQILESLVVAPFYVNTVATTRNYDAIGYSTAVINGKHSCIPVPMLRPTYKHIRQTQDRRYTSGVAISV